MTKCMVEEHAAEDAEGGEQVQVRVGLRVKEEGQVDRDGLRWGGGLDPSPAFSDTPHSSVCFPRASLCQQIRRLLATGQFPAVPGCLGVRQSPPQASSSSFKACRVRFGVGGAAEPPPQIPKVPTARKKSNFHRKLAELDRPGPKTTHNHHLG